MDGDANQPTTKTEQAPTTHGSMDQNNLPILKMIAEHKFAPDRDDPSTGTRNYGEKLEQQQNHAREQIRRIEEGATHPDGETTTQVARTQPDDGPATAQAASPSARAGGRSFDKNSLTATQFSADERVQLTRLSEAIQKGTATHTEIKEGQKLLHAHGYNIKHHGSLDGVDGVAGSKTRSALTKALSQAPA